MVAEFKVGERLGTSIEWDRKDNVWFKILKQDKKKIPEKIVFNKELSLV